MEGIIFPSEGQLLEIELSQDAAALKKGQRWRFYQPHWDSPQGWKGVPAIPASTELKVPYYAQCDTRGDGYRYCFSHAMAMAMCFLKPALIRKSTQLGFSQPEQMHICNLVGDTTDAQAQIAAAKKEGLDCYFSPTLSPRDLYELLSKGIPVPVGLRYKDSGHWVVVVGRKGSDWIVHDPYGIRNGIQDEYLMNSTDSGREGAYDVYTSTAFESLFWDLARDSNKECGWAIVFTAVDGKSTGAPSDL
jgi:Peptidase_C39 like family